MPELARFFGVVVTMHYNDRVPPHVHARYRGERASRRLPLVPIAPLE